MINNSIANETVQAKGTGVSVIPLGIIGSILNLILVGIILLSKKLRSPSYIFVLNLAVSDLLMSVQVSFIYVIDKASFELTTLISDVLCKLRYFVILTCYSASVLSLAVISLYRLEVVLQPLRQSSIKFIFNRPKITVIFIWLTCIILNIPVILTIRYDDQIGVCDLYFPLGQLYSSICFGILLTLTYFIPLVIMVLTYHRIGIRLRATNSAIFVSSSRNNHGLNHRTKIAIKFLSIATAIYMLLSWPLLVSFLIQAILGLTYSAMYHKSSAAAAFHIIANSVTFMVSLINPILYLIYDKNIKLEIRRLNRIIIAYLFRDQ
ncbi:Tachykinin-like peptides receptor 99D [Trichoplax sp. H2]|nr:Tachykinin-like peptides receptor 99D [Trichoplax sp. H2]|eukprot:RDD39663.1 Tachykinin-like peptides receptor 99D [Trichoplax sp. H2]